MNSILGSAKPSNIRAKFENLAKQGEEESRKKAEEERRKRRLQEQQEEKEAKEREERRLRELKEKEAALVSHKNSFFPIIFFHNICEEVKKEGLEVYTTVIFLLVSDRVRMLVLSLV